MVKEKSVFGQLVVEKSEVKKSVALDRQSLKLLHVYNVCCALHHLHELF